ncbi:hypothetical protein HOG48_03340 [Candidatus Peregrinibacteria bacterium]|nr:hypothetical protein [Candidatus Peregrinibacteria bacterium]
MSFHIVVVRGYLDEVMRNQYVDLLDKELVIPSYSMPLNVYYDYQIDEWGIRSKEMFSDRNKIIDDELPEMRMYIDESYLDELEENLPASGKVYKEATLKYGWDEFEIKMRYKGLNAYHWNGLKKSYKIKLEDGGIDGRDSFKLDNIKTLPIIYSYLANRVAEDFGIITSKTDFVKLYINDRYEGLYMMFDEFDEEFLEERGLPDGEIYSAKNLNEYSHPHLPVNIYESAYTWGRDYDDFLGRENLENFLEVLQSVIEGSGSSDELYQVLDRDYFVRFAAWLVAIQSPHLDYFHNNVLYFNSENGKMYAIPSDSAGFEALFSINIVSNDLLLALHKDPKFVFDKNRMVYEKYTEGEYPVAIKDMFTSYVEKITPAVKGASHIVFGMYGLRTPIPVEEYDSRIATTGGRINGYTAIPQHLSANTASYKTDGSSLIVSSDNYAGISLKGIDGCSGVYRDVDRDGVGDMSVDWNEPLYSGLLYEKKKTLYQDYNMFMPLAPLHYHYVLSGACEPSAVRVKNLITGEEFEARRVEELREESNFTVHPWG